MKALNQNVLVGFIVEEKRIGLIAWSSEGVELDKIWHSLAKHEIYELIIFNQQHIAQLIHSFIQPYSAQGRVPIIIALDGPGLYEELSLVQPITSKAGYASACYRIGEQWYTAGIPYCLRAQYHLLVARLPVELLSITTVTAAYCWLLNQQEKTAYTFLSCIEFKQKAPQLLAPPLVDAAYLAGIYALADQ